MSTDWGQLFGFWVKGSGQPTNVTTKCLNRIERDGGEFAVVVIELTDIFFALDSIPAIFGVTRDTLIVYTSNIFSVIGLRALYFAIAGLMERLRYLHYGLAVLMVLIGIKMIAGNIVEIPVWVTLSGTLAIVTATMAVSLLWSRPKPAKA